MALRHHGANGAFIAEETIELPDGRSFPRTYIVNLEELNKLTDATFKQLLETINNTYPQEETN